MKQYTVDVEGVVQIAGDLHCKSEEALQINPTGHEKHYHWRQGDGWPTIDVCTSCVRKFPVGKELDDEFPGVVSENDVEHPPYDDSIYNCAICGITLTEGN